MTIFCFRFIKVLKYRCKKIRNDLKCIMWDFAPITILYHNFLDFTTIFFEFASFKHDIIYLLRSF